MPLGNDVGMAHPWLYDALDEHHHRNTTGERASEMTEITTIEAVSPTDEAVAIIDRALSEMLHRELISTSEVADLLLDLRSLLVADKDVVLVEG